MPVSPYTVVATSAVSYSTILVFLRATKIPSVDLRSLIKSISALHATGTTIFALSSMTGSWDMKSVQPGSLNSKQPLKYIDDSGNPIIAGRQQLANAVTAWETGYLIYDTAALLLEQHNKDNARGLVSACKNLFRRSPIFVFHHLALISALLYLQSYIKAGREKGLWIIMAFICMNASTPLLHLRWWYKRRTKKNNFLVDASLVIVFALARFGTVFWVMKKYGQYHHLSAWEAFIRQRWQCKTGTGLLTGMNLAWWILLVSQMGRRRSR